MPSKRARQEGDEAEVGELGWSRMIVISLRPPLCLNAKPSIQCRTIGKVMGVQPRSGGHVLQGFVG